MSARVTSRLIGVALAAVLLAGLTACGSHERSKAALGSPENPIAAKPSKAAGATSEGAAEPAGFKSLVEGQAKERVHQDSGNPCALVTKAQAQRILGAKLLDPVVAPQGPTCLYRDRAGQAFATISVQSQRFKDLRPQIRRVERIDVSGHTAYCGVQGQPMLYLPLSGARVLSVAAPCKTAARFARRAAAQLLS
jgi:uncharacterized protein DUF3558